MSSVFFLNFQLFLQKSTYFLPLEEAGEKQQSNNPTAKPDDKTSRLQSHLTRQENDTQLLVYETCTAIMECAG